MTRPPAARARALVAAALAAAAAAAAAGCTAGPIDVGTLPRESLDDNLVAHFNFDEGSGAVVHDDSGNLRDGALSGATYVPGQFGTALHFVPGDQVTVPSFPDGTTSFTVALWVRIGAAELGAGYVTLVTAEIPFMGGWEVNAIFTDGPARYHFGYYVGPNDDDYDYAECDCFMPDRWVHVAAVVDGGTSKLRFYVDGALVREVDTRAAIKPGNPTLLMGTWSDTNMLRQLTGALDDVAIWSRALVPQEITALTARAVHGM